ncbi:hypothetical protein EV294_105310 [Paenibacillus sp. BK033]|uniref:hypothetical protein n=1 Tax=Paenibacillus sp. BK033 TaxID=2512133 RepID=UPI0010D6BF22|nr:hypothetical protein [Paenibacillus sp. BK033]TCM96443.1 hypothetical protein EV294_105310 [Paenibacillus sp. BK033]
MMNKKSVGLLAASLAILVVMSACGNKADTGNANTTNEGTVTEAPSNSPDNNAGNAEESMAPGNTASSEPAGESTAPESSTPENAAPDATKSSNAAGENANEEILIIIDQTEKPIEGNSFDFSVNKRPEGYMLSKMEWKSGKTSIVNTTQEAIEHGGNGEDGFYISGNGQFMGFFYPDDLKGQKGDVTFTFVNDAGKELTWKKTITLK